MCFPGVKLAIGVCTDLNPRGNEELADSLVFAVHVLDTGSGMMLLPMAWTTLQLTRAEVEGVALLEPDETTLNYWVQCFRPLVNANRVTVVVLANKCGVEESAVYTVTSVIPRVGHGQVDVLGILGKDEDGLLVADTEQRPAFMWDDTLKYLEPVDDFANVD